MDRHVASLWNLTALIRARETILYSLLVKWQIISRLPTSKCLFMWVYHVYYHVVCHAEQCRWPSLFMTTCFPCFQVLLTTAYSASPTSVSLDILECIKNEDMRTVLACTRMFLLRQEDAGWNCAVMFRYVVNWVMIKCTRFKQMPGLVYWFLNR